MSEINSSGKLESSKFSLESLDGRLAKYLAATAGIGAVLAQDAHAVIIANTTPQPFGINGEVNIDFNRDGQTDFQIDHDRYNLAGNNLDYLQVDKNDASSAANPLPVEPFGTFPVNGTAPNGDPQYLAFSNSFGDLGGYVVALKPGDLIGTLGSGNGKGVLEGTQFDFQEGTEFLATGGPTIRANRLIDEDQGQVDTSLVPSEAIQLPFGPQPEFPNLDDFIGLGGATRYVGVRFDPNDSLNSGLNNNDTANKFVHGWIGVQITNEADATGIVTGWAYESTPGMSIAAGDVGPPVATPGDYSGNNSVGPEDYTLWASKFGENTATAGLANLNPAKVGSTVDASDYTFWRDRVGGPAAASAVPEPASLLVAAFGGVALLGSLALGRLRSRCKE
jgi:hypothetical protein